MRQKLLFLLAILPFLFTARISAFYYKYGGVTLRYSVIDEEAKICRVDGYQEFSGALVIPDIANDGMADYTVTEIGNGGLKNCKNMSSVVIGNSVQTIGESAFSGCSGLKSAVIGNSIISIGQSAFAYCSGLTSVEIPNSVVEIGSSAFVNCRGLASVLIPHSVISIGNDAFEGCYSLIKSAYPDFLENPFGNSFAVAYNPKETIIEDGWIWGLKKEKIIFVPYDYEGKCILPRTVNSIGKYAFYRCEKLTSVVIPNTVKIIGSNAFSCCTSLNSVVIPNSVTEIGESAFSDCGGLKSVIISNSITKIDEYVFGNCRSLTSVEIPNSVTEIGSAAFMDCECLISVKIPNSVISIDRSAFSSCASLTDIDIPNSVTEIGEGAFAFCNSLPSVEIPNSVTKIRNDTFFWCNSLTSVKIPNSVTEIGEAAFFSCSNLISVLIPNSVIVIGEGAFRDCKKLDKIIIGHGLKNIRKKAFDSCPTSNIYITAQTPPEIWEVKFSKYPDIHVQGKVAMSLYYNNKDWYELSSGYRLMIEPTALEIDVIDSINGNPGDTFQLDAKLTPENITLPYIFWRSTNPKVATVDNNGLVTLKEYTTEGDFSRADGEEDNYGTCKIIAETLYFDGPIAEIPINNTDFNGVETVFDRDDKSIDDTLPYEVYNMNGLKVSDSTESLAKGIYIIRQGNAAVKTVMR